jgi:membrane-associated phospholipid phosphatase
MATNKIVATHAQERQLHKVDEMGIRSPGLLAKWPIIGLLMFLFGGLAFGALTFNLLAQGPLLQLDRTLATVLPAIGLKHATLLKPLMDSGYYIGSWATAILGFLFGIYFIVKRFWQELTMLAVAMAGESLLFWTISSFFGRARPPTQIWIVLHIPGFPSGHSMASVVLFGFLAYLLVPKIQSAFGKGLMVGVTILVILFVGFTRVFTAAHYLTDVLAGYAMGIAWSGMVYTLIEMYFQKRRSLHTQKT